MSRQSELIDISQGVTGATVVNGSAKAWVNFNGTGTIATRDSFNVASLTDNGVGDYNVNATNAMAGNDFAVSFSVQIPAVIAGVRVPTILTTSWLMLSSTTSGLADAEPITSAIHGDLA